LVVVNSGGVRAAVPLADIARLEQFDASEIEHSRGNNVVQYRDRVMTLIDLAHAVPEAAYGSIADAGPVPVLVLNNGRLDIGVTVNGIVDIVEATVLDTPTSDFVMGTALVDGKVTDIVDAKAFAQALTGSFDEPVVDVTDTTERV
jgi:two-component system chemotaxis sensor kinase CheA